MPGLVPTFDFRPPNMPNYEPVQLSTDWTGEHTMANNMASITRANWADYKKRFVPLENMLIGQIGNRDVYQQSVERSVGSVDDAFEGQLAAFGRQRSRYNLGLTNDETQNMGRRLGLREAVAKTTAARRARQQVYSRNMGLLAGGLSSQKPDSNELIGVG